MFLLAFLSACASQQFYTGNGSWQFLQDLPPQQQAAYYRAHSPAYDPPGPPSDPWGPYIDDASQRFDVPKTWIEQVMETESDDQEYLDGELITSDAGAVGLLQLMPSTYHELALQYHLGSDPYNPYYNIMAGTAYIRQLYNTFGSPGFLGAYNAGPARYQAYLNGEEPLPEQTQDYISAIAPRIAGISPLPLSMADTEGPLPYPYTPPPQAQNIPAPPPPAPVIQTVAPPQPVTGPVPEQIIERAPLIKAEPPPAPAPPGEIPMTGIAFNGSALPEAMSAPVPYGSHNADRISAVVNQTLYPSRYAPENDPPPPLPPNYGIQVGAYLARDRAELALTVASHTAYPFLEDASAQIVPLYTDGHYFYLARLTGISQNTAKAACQVLADSPVACMVITA